MNLPTKDYLNYLYVMENFQRDMQQLNEMTILQEITQGKINTTINRFTLGEKILKKYGVTKDMIKKISSKYQKIVKKLYDDQKDPGDASKEFIKLVKKDVMSLYKIAKINFDKTSITKKILISLFAFIVILFINTISMGIIVGFGIPIAKAFAIIVVICGPAIEEAAKTYFINKSMPWVGTGVVFGMEFVIYAYKLLSIGMSLPAVLVGRIITLTMHFVTTYIQKQIIKDPENTDLSNKQRSFMAWIAGFIVHSTWNFIAISNM